MGLRIFTERDRGLLERWLEELGLSKEPAAGPPKGPQEP
jgi:hypothetical protein